ncbi:MAG: response regulator transcription factor [Bacteroidales bacterium]|nr:response regulator transcription factor [Bacteroidales bacterium]
MKTTRNKIMLVEDSQNLRFVLKDYFEMLDFQVSDFCDGNVALEAFDKGRFDICVFDIMMPGKDGFTLMQEVRKIDPLIPVILLTSKQSKEDKIKGFKLGCDDYVIKPFSTEELTLRIKAILRRTQNTIEVPKSLYEEKIYKLGNYTFNYSAMELSHPKATRILTRKEAELLRLFCEYKNKLLTRETILREVWGDEDYAVGRSMDVFLTKLRSYLSLDEVPEEHINKGGGRHNKYEPGFEPLVEIVNVHGTGFILKVRE